VALYLDGCAALFGIECPECGEPHGVAATGPAFFDSEDDARSFFDAPDAVVLPMER
jgi:hypothetical protein